MYGLGVFGMTEGSCVGEDNGVGEGGMDVLWCGGVTGSRDCADPGGELLGFCVGNRLCVGWQFTAPRQKKITSFGASTHFLKKT